MSSKYLFSNKHRLWSATAFLVSFGFLIYIQVTNISPDFFEILVPDFFDSANLFSDITGDYWMRNNILDEIFTVTAIVSGLIWAFSREKVEDEMISELRKQSLIISVYINYGFYIIATILIYGMPFLNVLMLNVFTILIFFIILFNWKKYQLKKSSDEE